MECKIFFLCLLRNLFCDYYNSQQKIYCKRLRVLCPEHTKEPKVTRQTQFTGWLSSITQTSWPFVSFVRMRQKLDMFWENSFCAKIRTLALLREPINQGALFDPYCHTVAWKLCLGKGWLRELLKVIGFCLPPRWLLHLILCEYTVTDSQLSRGYSISLARLTLVARWLRSSSRVG